MSLTSSAAFCLVNVSLSATASTSSALWSSFAGSLISAIISVSLLYFDGSISLIMRATAVILSSSLKALAHTPSLMIMSDLSRYATFHGNTQGFISSFLPGILSRSPIRISYILRHSSMLSKYLENSAYVFFLTLPLYLRPSSYISSFIYTW